MGNPGQRPNEIMATVNHLTVVSLSAAAIWLGGCGGRKELYGVSGHVTLDGKPLSSVIVHFVPKAGPAACAQADIEGKYVMKTAGYGLGASPGRHQVWFESPPKNEALDRVSLDSNAYPRPPQPSVVFPERYRNPATSELAVTISPGMNSHSFALSSSSPPSAALVPGEN